MGKWNSRKLFAYAAALVTVMVLAHMHAPGDAYTALGLFGTAYLGGQAGVDAMQARQ